MFRGVSIGFGNATVSWLLARGGAKEMDAVFQQRKMHMSMAGNKNSN
jgi:hypothetical protein